MDGGPGEKVWRVKRCFASLLVLGSPASCGGNSVPAAPPPAVSESITTEAAPSIAPSHQNRPPKGESQVALILNRAAWEQGSLIAGVATDTPTRGGFPRLNRIGDELRALHARCRSPERPVPLTVTADVPAWQLLSVLGLMRSVGFVAAELTLANTSLRVALGEDARSATFFVVAEESVAVWWQAAREAASGGEGSLVFVLDPGLPDATFGAAKGAAMRPVGRIAPEQVNQRISAGYGAIYACLAMTQALPIPATLELELELGPRGGVQSVRARGQQAGSARSECLQRAFRTIAFPAPHGGPVTVEYPFSLTD